MNTKKAIEHCYTGLLVIVSALAGLGLGVVMLMIEKLLK